MKTGNTAHELGAELDVPGASMEPGHEDREYVGRHPVLPLHSGASMEPGHEDREYGLPGQDGDAGRRASMEPGHEDREYVTALGGLVVAW